jgi:hypothetical protein
MDASGDAREQPRYDSVVVRGNGIGALVFAARVARSRSLTGRVVLAGPPVAQDRRLIGGLTLRSRALDYYAAAFGTSRRALLEAVFGGLAARASTTRLFGGWGVLRPDGRMEIVRTQVALESGECGGRPLSFGVRNAHLAGRLEVLTHGLGVVREEAPADSVEACRALAPGDRPLVVNATSRPLRPHGERPDRMVVAVQLPLAGTRRRERGVLPDGASLLCALRRAGRNDIGVFNPIVDPLSAQAEAYGIVYRVERASAELAGGPGRERALAALRDELHALCDALGYEPVDADATEGSAVVPCSPWRHRGSVVDGLLELSRIYDAGAPIITGDGMSRAGVAGLVAAEAVLAGEDPVAHTNRALARWRRSNRMLCAGMTWAAPLAAVGFRLAPGRAVRSGAVPDTWAGVAAMDMEQAA